MRILADENIPNETVGALRQLGHDVSSIGEESPGAADTLVLERASNESRIVLTFDKDFGELAFRQRSHQLPGVILLRLQARDSGSLTGTVVSALSSRDDWAGHFSVIESQRIRMTPLPDAD